MTVTINGSGTITGISTGGLPDGCVDADTLASGLATQGVTVADIWRTNAHFTISNGSLVTLSGNYERHDQTGYGQLGSGMTESSGVFTFPSTGIYQVSANIFCQSIAGEPTATYVHLQTTSDNGSNWDNGAINGSGADGTNHLYNMSVMTLFDVTNVSTHKVRFAMYTSRDDQRCLGQTTQSLTTFSFIRLGDT